MGARKRVRDEAILESIQRWRGNVTAAAEELGLAPINLRKRLFALRVDLPLLRRLQRTDIPGIHGRNRSGMAPIASVPSHGNAPRKETEGSIFSVVAKRPRLGTVTTDVMMRPKAPAPIRLTPPQVEKLRDAKFSLQYRLKEDITESAILQQFFEDGFNDWLSMKLQDPEETQGIVSGEQKVGRE